MRSQKEHESGYQKDDENRENLEKCVVGQYASSELVYVLVVHLSVQRLPKVLHDRRPHVSSGSVSKRKRRRALSADGYGSVWQLWLEGVSSGFFASCEI